MVQKQRASGIELLRILMMLGVVVLHYNGNIAFDLVEKGSLNFHFLQLLEVVFIGAVNVFVLISGYFLSTTEKRKAVKGFELVFQVILINLAFFLLSLLRGNTFSLFGFLASLLPNNYFVTFYTVLYLISPYLNLALQRLSRKQFQTILIMSFLLFSVVPTLLDMLENYGYFFSGLYPTNTMGSQYGYSLINFVLMYVIGAYIRRFEEGRQFKFYRCGLIFGLSVVLLCFWQLFMPEVARAYSNPLVILSAVCLFLIFRNFKFQSAIVNVFAKAAFTCFLIHSYLLPFIGVEKVISGNILVLALHVLASALIIYLISWCAWRLYSWVTGPILRKIGTRLIWLDGLLSVDVQGNE